MVAFIDDCCDERPDGRAYLRDLRRVMKVWASEQGIKSPLPNNALKRKLEGLGYYVGKDDGKSCVHGLSLRVYSESRE
jgi:hypothetical protein